MEVSVIVPTYNGEKKIPVLLNALQLQTYRDFELIIVVDGSTDNTLNVVSCFRKHFSKMKLVVQENRGRGAVKNRGAIESTSELLIFYDDDMEPLPNSIEKHVAFHATTRCAILCGNPLELPDKAKTDIQNYKALKTINWTKHFVEGLNTITKESPFMTAANMSIRRELFNELKGFDERLRDIEDLEFAKRALRKNVPIYFDKSNRAIHHDPITCYNYINRVRQYTIAQHQLHTLFPNQFPDRSIRSSFKKYFYSLFAFSFWPRLIDNFNLIYILPAFMRYKIYDWVIYSLGVAFINKPLQNHVSK